MRRRGRARTRVTRSATLAIALSALLVAGVANALEQDELSPEGSEVVVVEASMPSGASTDDAAEVAPPSEEAVDSLATQEDPGAANATEGANAKAPAEEDDASALPDAQPTAQAAGAGSHRSMSPQTATDYVIDPARSERYEWGAVALPCEHETTTITVGVNDAFSIYGVDRSKPGVEASFEGNVVTLVIGKDYDPKQSAVTIYMDEYDDSYDVTVVFRGVTVGGAYEFEGVSWSSDHSSADAVYACSVCGAKASVPATVTSTYREGYSYDTHADDNVTTYVARVSAAASLDGQAHEATATVTTPGIVVDDVEPLRLTCKDQVVTAEVIVRRAAGSAPLDVLSVSGYPTVGMTVRPTKIDAVTTKITITVTKDVDATLFDDEYDEGLVVSTRDHTGRVDFLPRVTKDLAHHLAAVEAVAATCEEDGSEACWRCSVCGKLFADADGTTEIDAPASVAALGHDLRAVAGAAATGDATGVEPYWECARCGTLFADEDGTEALSAPVTFAYAATADADGTWAKGDGELALTFKRSVHDDATFERFARLEVDGVAVDEGAYVATKGSLNVRLSTAYLEGLTPGAHVVTAVFADGSVDAALTVAAATNTQSSDETKADAAAGAGATSVAGGTTSVAVGKADAVASAGTGAVRAAGALPATGDHEPTPVVATLGVALLLAATFVRRRETRRRG